MKRGGRAWTGPCDAAESVAAALRMIAVHVRAARHEESKLAVIGLRYRPIRGWLAAPPVDRRETPADHAKMGRCHGQEQAGF